MTPELMRRVTAAARGAVADGCGGVLVTHGTDTLKETAYAPSLMLACAPRSRSPPAPAAPRSGRLSRSETSCTWRAGWPRSTRRALRRSGRRTLGRWALSSRGASSERRAAPTDLLGMPETLDGPNVELVWIAAGADGRLLDAAAGHADGIVVAGTGGGHVPPPAAVIRRAIDPGLPVVLSSRCGTAPLLEDSYAGDGSEGHLRSLGVVGTSRSPEGAVASAGRARSWLPGAPGVLLAKPSPGPWPVAAQPWGPSIGCAPPPPAHAERVVRDFLHARAPPARPG
jgi:L-asparaginase